MRDGDDWYKEFRPVSLQLKRRYTCTAVGVCRDLAPSRSIIDLQGQNDGGPTWQPELNEAVVHGLHGRIDDHASVLRLRADIDCRVSQFSLAAGD